MKMSDPQWASVPVGGSSSDRPCKYFGSAEICIAQALLLSGRPTDPRVVISELAHDHAYSADGDDTGPFVARIDVLPARWGYFHIGGTQYTLTQGKWGELNLTLLQLEDGTVFNPWTGDNTIPHGWVPGSHTRTFYIDAP
jgi:hypothetical protein